MKRFLSPLRALAGIAMLLVWLLPTAGQPVPFVVSTEPPLPLNGSPVLVRVKSSAILRSLAAGWMGRRFAFDYDAGTDAWYGLAGVEFDTPAGIYTLTLDAQPLDGAPLALAHRITTARARDRFSALRVPRRFTEPDAETLKRIEAERELKNRIFTEVSANRLWAGPFAAPLASATTSPFGVQRMFNKARQSLHQGLDYRAATGSPVQAMNAGAVLLARDMFFEGGLIVLDHGQGLSSLYLHLSEFSVKEGELVAKGQRIGLSGGTGRATSPHLHVGVRWHGIYLDPAMLLKLPLP
jgi:murein DD-endopeptidase MepM/ murein hydrolase activator NlpD